MGPIYHQPLRNLFIPISSLFFFLFLSHSVGDLPPNSPSESPPRPVSLDDHPFPPPPRSSPPSASSLTSSYQTQLSSLFTPTITGTTFHSGLSLSLIPPNDIPRSISVYHRHHPPVSSSPLPQNSQPSTTAFATENTSPTMPYYAPCPQVPRLPLPALSPTTDFSSNASSAVSSPTTDRIGLDSKPDSGLHTPVQHNLEILADRESVGNVCKGKNFFQFILHFYSPHRSLCNPFDLYQFRTPPPPFTHPPFRHRGQIYTSLFFFLSNITSRLFSLSCLVAIANARRPSARALFSFYFLFYFRCTSFWASLSTDRRHMYHPWADVMTTSWDQRCMGLHHGSQPFSLFFFIFIFIFFSSRNLEKSGLLRLLISAFPALQPLPGGFLCRSQSNDVFFFLFSFPFLSFGPALFRLLSVPHSSYHPHQPDWFALLTSRSGAQWADKSRSTLAVDRVRSIAETAR